MAINIPANIRGALDTNGLMDQYGTQNAVSQVFTRMCMPQNRVKPPINVAAAAAAAIPLVQNFANQGGFNNQPNYGNQGGYNNQPNYGNQGYNNQPNYGNQGGFNNQPNYGNQGYNNQPNCGNQPAPQPFTPTFNTNVPKDGAQLKRGQKIAITGNGQTIRELKIAMNWDILDPNCELDASAFMIQTHGKVRSDDWFVFYGQTNSPENSVRYMTGGAGENAAISIDLNRVDASVDKIVVAVTIYEAAARRMNFGKTKNLCARLIDTGSNKQLAYFDLSDAEPMITSMVVGELYRYKGTWKFNAVGSGYNKELADFCMIYGVDITG